MMPQGHMLYPFSKFTCIGHPKWQQGSCSLCKDWPWGSLGVSSSAASLQACISKINTDNSVPHSNYPTLPLLILFNASSALPAQCFYCVRISAFGALQTIRRPCLGQGIFDGENLKKEYRSKAKTWKNNSNVKKLAEKGVEEEESLFLQSPF